ncbi:YbgA family protein [Aneurinibacillus sp. REN35]|uniref:YbgA family protein n=1 Tax=Aneurinibacillus sp. REN35 TaxID=3237286 RepID=UPI003528D679
MRDFVKPKIVVSKCLEFEACRYNGQKIPDSFISKLIPHVDFIPVCPEVEIGLGTPRETIRIIRDKEEMRLIQPKSGLDVTEKMQAFSQAFISALTDIDGFIMKNRSPSCGVKDVKVYSASANPVVLHKDSGLFGGEVLKQYSHVAIEDEGRLKNFRIREHFLTKLYTVSTFRKAKAQQSIKELIKFHSDNKYLFMAYNQKELKVLGNIVANHERKPIGTVFEQYEEHLAKLFARVPRYASHINVMMHIMGYFSDQLSKREKDHFLILLERYRDGKLPLSSPLSVLRSWVIRFDHDYLLRQTYFEPYPDELVEITDSGKGRGEA